MGTRVERGGHGQRDGAFRNRITCVIRKLLLDKVEIPLKRPENREAGALYVHGKWRLPHGAAYREAQALSFLPTPLTVLVINPFA